MRIPTHLEALVIHDRRDVEALVRANESGTLPSIFTPNAKAKIWLADNDIPCDLIFPNEWSAAVPTIADMTDELLDKAYERAAPDFISSRQLWKRVSRYRFMYAASALLAVQETLRQLQLRFTDLSKVGIFVDPQRLAVLEGHIPGGTYSVLLNAFAPEMQYCSATDGQLVPPGIPIDVRFGSEFFQTTPIERLQPVDVLVLPFGIKDRWQDFVPADASFSTVSVRHGPRFELALGIGGGSPASVAMRALEHPPTATVDGALDALWPAIERLWLPRLRELKANCASFLAHTRPKEIITCDYASAEGALLADLRSPDTRLTLLSHDVGGADVPFWDPEPGLSVPVGTQTAVRKWTDRGVDATLDDRCFSFLHRVYSTGRSARTEGAPLDVLVVGPGDHWENHPIISAKNLHAGLDTALRIPDEIRGQITLSVKPRPGLRSAQMYEPYGDIDSMIDESVPLVEVFGAMDIAVVIENPTAAVLEAIAYGCVVVAIGDDPADERWRPPQRPDLTGIFNADVVPVVRDQDFWPTIAALAADQEALDRLRTAQASWLRTEISSPPVINVATRDERPTAGE